MATTSLSFESDYIEQLEHFFKRRTEPLEGDSGDDSDGGDCWELLLPERLHAWTLLLVPNTDYLTFSALFSDNTEYHPVSYDEKVLDVDHSGNFVLIRCETTLEKPYRFTLLINNCLSPYDISKFLASLSNSPFEPLIKEGEAQIDCSYWQSKSGEPLGAKTLSSKLRNQQRTLERFSMERKGRVAMMRPATVSQRTESGNISLGSTGQRTPAGRSTGSNLRTTQPSQTKRARAVPAPESSNRKKTKAISPEALDASIASALTDIPVDLEPGSVLDYENAFEIYEKFWAECQDCYLFPVDQKYELDVNKLDPAPAHWTIRAYEPQGMEKTKNFLVEMPDKSSKQTLCVMPQTEEKPETWEEIRNCRFFIINGQHSVAASKSMIAEGISEVILKHFRTWNCFIVWSQEPDKLRRISAYYNRVNHFSVFKPSWSTNIMSSRFIWTSMDRPSTSNTVTGPATRSRPSHRIIPNEKKWKSFLDAIKQRFALIDVSKSLEQIKKAGAKRGSAADALDLRNEVKIITSSDETFALWSELISSSAQGLLVDVDSKDLSKFKDRSSWQPAKDGVLNREFFKWLGNMSEADHQKMILHLLNRSGPQRRYKWPKVVLKQPSSVLDSCYMVKEWIERRKRKQLVRKELQTIKPSLGFFDADGEFIVEQWKVFKRKYNVSSATMRCLLEQPGDQFFAEAKMVRSKNKSAEELSPYAKQFFRTFLRKRLNFVRPTGKTFFRRFNSVENRLGAWPDSSWSAEGGNIKLGIIDFRVVPGYAAKAKSTVDKPYFDEFVKMFADAGMPPLNGPDVWLWICGNRDTEMQVLNFAQSAPFRDVYERGNSAYVPGKFEQLDDCATSSRQSKESVELLWLIKQTAPINVTIPREFAPPDDPTYTKPRKYNELEFRDHTGELRMEFYFRALEMFCKPGDAIFSAFGGTKLICAAMMSSLTMFCISHLEDGEHYMNMAKSALTLDKADFVPGGYPVDSSRFPHKSSRKGKEAAHEDDDDDFIDDRALDEVEDDAIRAIAPSVAVEVLDDDDESEEDVEDIPLERMQLFPDSGETATDPLTEDLELQGLVSPVLPSDEDVLYIQRPVSAPAALSSPSPPPRKRARATPTEVTTPAAKAPTDIASELMAMLMSMKASQDEATKVTAMLARQQEDMLDTQRRERESDARRRETERQELQAELERRNKELRDWTSSCLKDLSVEAAGKRVIVHDALPSTSKEPQLLFREISTDDRDRMASTSASSPQTSPICDSPSASPLLQTVEPALLPAECREDIVEPSPMVGSPSEPEMSPELGRSLPPSQSTSDNLNFEEDTSGFQRIDRSGYSSPVVVAFASGRSHTPPSLEEVGGSASVHVEVSGASGSNVTAVQDIARSPPRVQNKWLNIVLDLNGVLCVCEEFRKKPQGFTAYCNETMPHSSRVPAKVGPKLIYVRPRCSEFLRALSRIATVSVWSSMVLSTTKTICSYIFRGVDPPAHILGQNKCSRILTGSFRGRSTYLKVDNSDKDVFLKTLSVFLFRGYNGTFDEGNTVVINDGPDKHVLNNPANVVLAESWSVENGNGDSDTFLMNELLPWIQRLHESAVLGLHNFRAANSFGRPMLSADPYSVEFIRISDAIEFSKLLNA